MNKSFIYLIISILTFINITSCNKNYDGPAAATIRSHIIGKWKSTHVNEVEELTNEREVRSFYEDGTSFSSSTKYYKWLAKVQENYSVAENIITLQRIVDNHIVEQTISEIDDDTYNVSRFRYLQYPELGNKRSQVFRKLYADYSDKIIGLWEGVSLDGDTTYGNHEHRWEYKPNNTYLYYNRVNDEWVATNDVLCEYNVDGDWLATRWKKTEQSEEQYEWWDIEKCDDYEMIWVALREENGQRFTTKITMRRVTGKY